MPKFLKIRPTPLAHLEENILMSPGQSILSILRFTCVTNLLKIDYWYLFCQIKLLSSPPHS